MVNFEKKRNSNIEILALFDLQPPSHYFASEL